MSETNELNNNLGNEAADNIDNSAQDGADNGAANENLNKDAQGGADNGADDAGADKGTKTDDAGADKGTKTDDAGADDAGVYGAPEEYNYEAIKLPDGYEYDKDLLKEFDALNKKFNLSQQSANKYMEFGLKLAQKSAGNIPAILKQAQQTKIAQFKQALNTDKEIGGGDKTKMNAYLDVADKGYAAFATDEVKAVLADAGLNFHPAVVKMFHRIGELVGDDNVFAPKNPTGTPVDTADILYGSNKNA